MTGGGTPAGPTPPAAAGGVAVPESGRSGPGSWWTRAPAAGAALVALLLVVAAGSALIALYRRYLLSEIRSQISVQATPYGQSLGIALAHRIAILQGLENVLRLHARSAEVPGFLDAFTARVKMETPGIRAIQIVRDGVIVRVAPLDGNEAVLGLDLGRLPDPSVGAGLRRALQSDAVQVLGPQRLIQGGEGLIVRRRYPKPDGDGFDIAALIIDFQSVLADVGLDAPVGLRVALRDSTERLIFGEAQLGRLAPVVVPVRSPAGSWKLEAIPARGWDAAIRERLLLLTFGVVLCGILIVAVTYLVALRQWALTGAVASGTESLHAATEELRRIAEEKASAEHQLRQAQRLESLGRFAGGIAHDFNNHLTVILGSLALARLELPAESDRVAQLGDAEQAALRARELTTKLLAFARHQPVTVRPIDLNAQLTESQRMLRRLVSERIDIRLDLAPGLQPVQLDPGQLDQVVTNLAVNASDAMPDGGTLTLRTRNVHLATELAIPRGIEAGEYVQLEVEDTGVGMTGEVLQHLFEPFFTTKEVGKGTGLGLSTVYGIVRQAGGGVGVESEVGRGTRIQLNFPRSLDQPAEAEAAVIPVAPRSAGGESILLVEDDAAVRRITSRILGAAGYHLIAAEDGESALRRLLPGDRIDLLVTDLVTPGIGGRAIAERMLQRDPEMRILFISGYTADERIEDLLKLQGVAFLPKPFTISQLQRAVRHLLDLPRRR